MFIDDPKKPPEIDVEEPKNESKKPEPKKPEEPKLEVPKKSEELEKSQHEIQTVCVDDTGAKPKITKKRTSKSLKHVKKPSLASEPDVEVDPNAELEVESELRPKKTSVQTLPDEFGTVPPEKPDPEPFIYDPLDPESDTKLETYQKDCRIKFGRNAHIVDVDKWQC